MAQSTNTKGAPHAKLVLSALSLVAMMGGWANLTLAEHAARKDAVTSMALAPAAASNAEVAPVAEFTIELPAMPTVAPLKVPTVAPVVVVNVPQAAPIAPAAAPAAAVASAPEPAPVALRVVSAPPRPKESGGGGGGGGGGGAPAPAAQTRSSK